MSLLYSVVLFSISVALARYIYAVSRRPVRPRWAREGVMTSLVVVVVGMLAFGTGFLSDAVFAWERQDIGIAQAGIMLAAMTAAAGVWMWSGRMLRGTVPGTVVSFPGPGSDPETPDHGGPSPAVAREVRGGRPDKAA